MKKYSFLIPVAMAAAALSGQASAKAHETTTIGTETVAKANTALAEGVTESFYVKDDELHSLMMKTAASGDVLAWHNSHMSHSSHASHSSHYSHRSGY